MAFGPDVPERFEREQSISESEWLRCLPGAVRDHALELPAPGRARVPIGEGDLWLQWNPLPPRRLALVQLPRLQVQFHFDRVDAAARAEFMRYFDLYTHRGGG